MISNIFKILDEREKVPFLSNSVLYLSSKPSHTRVMRNVWNNRLSSTFKKNVELMATSKAKQGCFAANKILKCSKYI